MTTRVFMQKIFTAVCLTLAIIAIAAAPARTVINAHTSAGDRMDNILWESEFCCGYEPAVHAMTLFGGVNNSSVMVDPDGHIVVIGRVGFTWSGGIYINITKHEGGTGAVLWNIRYPYGAGINEGLSIANDAYIDGRGDIFIARNVYKTLFVTPCQGCGGLIDGEIVKFSGVDGRVLWVRAYDGGLYDNITEIVGDAEGNIFIADAIYGIGSPETGHGENVRIVKYDGASGDILWEQIFDSDARDSLFQGGMTIHRSGDPIAVYFINPNDAGQLPPYQYLTAETRVMRYDNQTGTAVWRAGINAEHEHQWWRMHLTDAAAPDVVFLVGEVYEDTDGVYGRYDGTVRQYGGIAKIDAATGAVLWQRKLNDLSIVHNLRIDPEGDLIISGQSGESVHVLKIDKVTGRTVWQQIPSGGGRVSAMILDKSGDLIVGTAGAIRVDGETRSATILTQYDNATGQALWNTTVGGAFHGEQVYGTGVAALAVDEESQLIAALNLTLGFGHSKAYIIKYGRNINRAPVASFVFTPQNPKAGDEVLFDASASEDPDGVIALYEWDWNGDGRYEEYQQSSIASHVWTAAGDYTVRLRVIDDARGEGTTEQIITAHVSPISKTFDASWTVFEKFSRLFDAVFTPPLDDRIDALMRDLDTIRMIDEWLRDKNGDDVADADTAPFDWLRGTRCAGTDSSYAKKFCLIAALNAAIIQDAGITYKDYVTKVIQEQEQVEEALVTQTPRYPVALMAEIFLPDPSWLLLHDIKTETIKYLLTKSLSSFLSDTATADLIEFGSPLLSAGLKAIKFKADIEKTDDWVYQQSLQAYFLGRSLGRNPDAAWDFSPAVLLRPRMDAQLLADTKILFEEWWQTYSVGVKEKYSVDWDARGLPNVFKRDLKHGLQELIRSAIQNLVF